MGTRPLCQAKTSHSNEWLFLCPAQRRYAAAIERLQRQKPVREPNCIACSARSNIQGVRRTGQSLCETDLYEAANLPIGQGESNSLNPLKFRAKIATCGVCRTSTAHPRAVFSYSNRFRLPQKIGGKGCAAARGSLTGKRAFTPGTISARGVSVLPKLIRTMRTLFSIR